jgi:hypothetical protein
MRLAFVLTTTRRLPTRAAIDAAVAEYDELAPATWLDTSSADTLALEAGGVAVMAALVPAPVPNGEADAAAEHSLAAVAGKWALPAHTAHLACMLRQGDSGLAELVRFTRVVGALARAAGAVGVYWGEGHVTHHPELFIELARSELPLPLWVGVSVAKRRGGVELLSIGMKQLDLPELLLTAPKAGPRVLELFYELLAYVARRGEALPEGDTIGHAETQHLTVTYGPSPVEAGAQVWRVQLPAGKRPTRARTAKPSPRSKKARRPARR